jgi:transposase
MTAKRTHYTREFKVAAVRRILENGQTIAEVARDLGIRANQVGKWKRDFVAKAGHSFPGKGQQSPEQEELSRLREENVRLRRENDFLKKTAAFFAKESK